MLGNNEKAIEYFNKSLEIDENYIWVLNQLSIIYSTIQNHQKSYEITKKLSILKPDDYNYYFNLSWYSLFANKPKEAIIAAKKTLELNPEATGVYSNLALGYVLNNQYDLAEPIYLEWKDKQFNNNLTFKEAFLQDIADLETAGIVHPDFEKVRELLK